LSFSLLKIPFFSLSLPPVVRFRFFCAQEEEEEEEEEEEREDYTFCDFSFRQWTPLSFSSSSSSSSVSSDADTDTRCLYLWRRVLGFPPLSVWLFVLGVFCLFADDGEGRFLPVWNFGLKMEGRKEGWLLLMKTSGRIGGKRVFVVLP
jgi:hypothetical protein